MSNTFMIPNQQGCNVNAVRVWRGYRANRYINDPQGFYKELGSIFIPATVQFMEPLGLVAYLPTVLMAGMPGLPDEIALVFYPTQEHYQRVTRNSVVGRAYGRLHANVFNFTSGEGQHKSTSQFPIFFQGSLTPGQPYYLFDREVNWRLGTTDVIVQKRREDVDQQSFSEQLCTFLSDQQGLNSNIDAVICLVDNDYIFYWAHQPQAHAPIMACPQLTNFSTCVYIGQTEPLPIPPIFSDADGAVTLMDSASFNVSLGYTF